MIEEYKLKNNSIMKKKNQKELSFAKETIAVLNNATLHKILGGKSIISGVDTTDTSKFHSDGPPPTAISG